MTSFDSSGFFVNLNSLKDKFCDIDIVCEEEVFKAHKIILSTRSDYFKDKLLSLNGENKLEVINVKPAAMAEILSFFYSNNIRLTRENILEISIAAKELGVHDLMKLCFDAVMNHASDNEKLGLIHLFIDSAFPRYTQSMHPTTKRGPFICFICAGKFAKKADISKHVPFCYKVKQIAECPTMEGKKLLHQKLFGTSFNP